VPDIFETRCVSARFDRSDHLCRVACIGDSMVWGQGTAARQTLPAHLMRLLNAALPDQLVWVDNFGLSSGNLWHSWASLRAQAQDKRFDAIVFSVCQNDTQIFEHYTVAYGSDKSCYWEADTVYFRQAGRLFADFAQFCKDSGTVAIVVYYSFVASDRKIIEALRPVIESLGIPFIDMLEFYRHHTAMTIETYRASEFDGHPSSLGHEMAARRVTTELLNRLDQARPSRFAADPAGVLGGAVADLVDQHVPVDAALEWAREAIAAKERAARRRPRGDRAAAAATYAGLAGRIARCETAWRLARRIEACAALVEPPADYMTRTLPNLHRAETILDEAVFLLEQSVGVEELGQLGALFVEDGHFGQADRLAFFSGDVSGEIGRLRARLGAFTAIKPEWVEEMTECVIGTSRSLRDSLDPRAIGPDLLLAFSAAARLRADLDALDAVAARLGHLVEEPSARRLWAIVLYLAHGFAGALEGIDRMLSRCLPLSASVGAPWTCVEVTLEGGPDPEVVGEVCRLQVEADYLVPRRARLREVHWAGVAKPRGVYRFELPVMVLGTLRVGVSDDEPTRQRFANGTTRLARIDIFNTARDHAVSWTDPGGTRSSVEFSRLALP